MHELSAALNIIETVKQNVHYSEMENIAEIRLKLGKFSNINTESLIFAFESIKDEHKLSNAALKIEHVKFEIECKDCGSITSNIYGLRECDVCSSMDTSVLSGEEFLISEIEITG